MAIILGLGSTFQRYLKGVLPTGAAKLMTRSIEDLCSVDPETKRELVETAEALVAEGKSTGDACNDLVNKAFGLGVGLPQDFILYNRGRTFLENQIRDMNLEMERSDPEYSIERADFEAMFWGVMVRRLGKMFSERFYLCIKEMKGF